MEDMNVTMEMILSVFRNYSDGKRLKDIKAAVVALLTPPDQIINPDQANIEKRVETLIKEDRKLENESELVYSSKGGVYKKRKKRFGPDPSNLLLSSEYVGIAGECAVMSELLFNGYNANRMMVDEGVDIIAVKNNLYFYIQVKTTIVKDGRVYCQIPIDRFDQYIAAQIRYIIVARYNDKGNEKNMFFTFNPQEISKGIHDRYIKQGENSVSIKIKFSEKSGNPYLYDEKECDISWNMNRFSL